MMEFLPIDEVIKREQEIRNELDDLFRNRSLVQRPKALQWQFLRACADRLFNPKSPSKFDEFESSRLAQLKFQVEDKLRHYFLRDTKPVRFSFTVMHQRDLEPYDIDLARYPDIAGYSLMVRDVTAEAVGFDDLTEEKMYIERVVTEAIDAELEAYCLLPEIQTDSLQRWFSTKGTAYLQILHVLTRVSKRGWVINNSFNPSTKRLLSINVQNISQGEATVATREYWFLRWWDTKNLEYVYPYRETNNQTYVLRREDGEWKVWENPRPAPRTSVPYSRVMRDKRKRSKS